MTPPGPVSTIQRWWPALLWTALIFVLSSVPGSRLEGIGVQIPDKLVHGLEYAGLGFLAGVAARGGRVPPRTAAMRAVLFGVAIGILDENYQRLIPGRDPSAGDALADLVGTVLGVLLSGTRAGGLVAGRRST